MNLATVFAGLAILVAERFRVGNSITGRFRLALRTTSLFALIAALAVYPKSRQWMIAPAERPTVWACIDVSRSMTTRDVAPDRLSRAKSILQSMLPVLEGFPVGVIAFAGDARVVCPPTSDHVFVETSIRDLTIGSAATGGSNLLAPFKLIERGDRESVIIMASDGGHRSLPANGMSAMKRRPTAIMIGVGNSTVSAPMPEGRGGFSTTTTRLEEMPMRMLAEQTGGAYVPAGTSEMDGAGILSRVLSALIPQAYPQWSQRFSWVFVVFGIALALAEPIIELFAYRRQPQEIGA